MSDMTKTVKPVEVFHLMSIKDVCRVTSLSRSTLWKKVQAGQFPKPISLSDDGIRKAFLAYEVKDWMESRIALRDAENGA